jgi:hypothetical protein
MRKMINDKIKSSSMYKEINKNDDYKEYKNILNIYNINQIEMMLPFSSSISFSSIISTPGGVEGTLWSLLPTVDTSAILHSNTNTIDGHWKTHLSYELSDTVAPSLAYKKTYNQNLAFNKKIVIRLTEYNVIFNSNENTFVGCGLIGDYASEFLNETSNKTYFLRKNGNINPLNTTWEIVHEGVVVYRIQIPLTGDFYFRFTTSIDGSTVFYEFSDQVDSGFRGVSFPRTNGHNIYYALVAKGGWIETNVVDQLLFNRDYYFPNNPSRIINIEPINFINPNSFVTNNINFKSKLPFEAIIAPSASEINDYRIGFIAYNNIFNQESLDGVYVNGSANIYTVGSNGVNFFPLPENGYKNFLLFRISEYRFKLIVEVKIFSFFTINDFSTLPAIFTIDSSYNLKVNNIVAYVRTYGTGGYISNYEKVNEMSINRLYKNTPYLNLQNSDYYTAYYNFADAISEVNQIYTFRRDFIITNSTNSPIWGVSSWGIGIGISDSDTIPVGSNFDDYASHFTTNGCGLIFKTGEFAFSIIENGILNFPTVKSSVFNTPEINNVQYKFIINLKRVSSTSFEIQFIVLNQSNTTLVTHTYTKTFSSDCYLHMYRKILNNTLIGADDFKGGMSLSYIYN